MTTVGFLYDSNDASEEERSAWSFLTSRPRIKAKRLSVSELIHSPKLLKSDVLWWHCDSSTEIPTVMKDPDVITVVRNFAYRGGGILLTLLASPFVVDLGFETKYPNRVALGEWREPSWAPDYPDMRGYAPFGPHPIFEGFPGGLFTSLPSTRLRHAAAYYEDVVPETGQVVAVEKCYIRLHEHRRVAVEYHHGRGRILTIGCHMQFAEQDERFRLQRDDFIEQCLGYLAEPRSRTGRKPTADSERRRSYWNFNPANVLQANRKRSPSWRKTAKVSAVSSDLEIHRDLQEKSANEFFDLSGDRIVVMGSERGGIEEVWCHPVRILRDLKVGFRVGRNAIQWSASLNPFVTIRPESFTRQYALEDAAIVETVFADSSHPAGGLCFHITSAQPVEVILHVCIDLRLMWPLSAESTGSLRYRWDDGYGGLVVTNETGALCSIVGSSISPQEVCFGQFDRLSEVDGRLEGQPTTRTQVAIGMRIAGGKGVTDVGVFFGGSNQGETDALKGYRAVSAHPDLSLSSNVTRFKRLERTSIRVQCPNEQFSRSLRWARWSLTRLFAATPGIGKSMMAGYGLSSAGWNGGHERSGRPGYAWYFGRDSLWAALGLLGSADFRRVRQVLEFLGSYQEPTGKVLHELTTSGFVHFDAADATPLYVLLMGKYVRASGDVEFCRSQFERVERAIRFCFTTDKDGDGFIENTGVGHGWVEGGPLFPAHAELYLQACWAGALEEAAFLARVANRPEPVHKWNKAARRVRSAIERELWNSKTGFYRFAKLSDGKYSEETTILSTVAMLLGCARSDRSQSSLVEFASANFTTDWGVRILSREHPSYNPAGYHSGSIWPLFTGWTALAEFKCGRPLQGMAHLLSTTSLADHFAGGCIEEVLHGDNFKPTGVCPHQAWSESMVLQPFFEGMLGLDVDALSRSVRLRPFLPPGWKRLEVSGISMGTSTLGFSVKQSADETVYKFTCKTAKRYAKSKKSLSLILQPLLPLGTRIKETLVDHRRIRERGTITHYDSTPSYKLRLSGSLEVRIRHQLGIGLVVQPPHLVREQSSKGIRIIEERWKGQTYELDVEGRRGREYLIDLYDPSGSMKAIEGGVALARSDGQVLVSLRFPGDEQDAQYVKTILRVRT